MVKKLEELIQERAYSYYVQRGYKHGNDREDWNRAEKEIREELAKAASEETKCCFAETNNTSEKISVIKSEPKSQKEVKKEIKKEVKVEEKPVKLEIKEKKNVVVKAEPKVEEKSAKKNSATDKTPIAKSKKSKKSKKSLF